MWTATAWSATACRRCFYLRREHDGLPVHSSRTLLDDLATLYCWRAERITQVPEEAAYIFAKLRARDSVEAAARGWWSAVNLRQHLLRLIARIGEKPWPRMWHSLRAAAETDIASRLPIHVAAEWRGNSVPVAAAHYLRVRLVEPWSGRGAKSGAQGGGQFGAADTGVQ